MNLPAYPKYKDSGVAWLGMVPEGWEVKKLGHLCSKIGSGKTPSGGAETYIAEGVLFLRSQNIYDEGLRLDDAVYIEEDVDSEMSNSRVLPHDILLNITGASLGRTCIVPNEFLSANVNQHVCIIRLADFKFAEYVSLFLKSAPSKGQFAINQNGAAREGLNFVQISKIALPFPPLPEQQAIAAFLDRETAQIDTLVEKQRRMLDLLKEKRTALISHAVTKGLNPDAKLKDSGVAWLGMVPEGWEVKRLRHVSRFKGGSTPSTDEAIYWEEGVIPWISPKDMKGVSISQTEDYLTPTGANQCASGILNPGHVLIVVRSGILRHTIPVAINTVPACINQDIRAFILKDSESSEYFKWFILGNQSALIDIWCKQGTTVESIEMNYLKDSCIAIPLLPEQQAIAAFLDRETAQIDTLASCIEDMIAKLQEYRTALITAAVTGKVDVRARASMKEA